MTGYLGWHNPSILKWAQLFPTPHVWQQLLGGSIEHV